MPDPDHDDLALLVTGVCLSVDRFLGYEQKISRSCLDDRPAFGAGLHPQNA
jgi:hypothetical protein